MDAKAATATTGRGGFPRGLLGDLDAAVAQQVVAAGGDVAMVIDRDGVIRDLALSNEDLDRDGAGAWLDRRWLDTVTVESRPKVDELLRDAAGGRTRWREVNQVTAGNESLMVRYVAVDAGRDGRVIAIGRDERQTSALQQRLVEAQQTLERDYSRLREAEGRYRLLFRTSGEAVIVVDAATRRIMEANPAAERALGDTGQPLVGESFPRLFDADSQDAAASLLAAARPGPRTQPSPVQLASQGRVFTAQGSLFRQDRASLALVRLLASEPGAAADRGGPDLRTVLERIPDAFLVTESEMRILTANAAFLDLARIATPEQALGQSLAAYLGRPGLDRNLLLDALRDHGAVRNFRTLLRDDYGDTEDVEISAAAAPYDGDTAFGFTIRSVDRRIGERAGAPPDLRRSVEQLTELVGRTTLKDLVRETTDLVERLCIEAALELTKNNRASAAEVLGLSRQSLYSKLHRFGLGNLSPDED